MITTKISFKEIRDNAELMTEVLQRAIKHFKVTKLGPQTGYFRDNVMGLIMNVYCNVTTDNKEVSVRIGDHSHPMKIYYTHEEWEKEELPELKALSDRLIANLCFKLSQQVLTKIENGKFVDALSSHVVDNEWDDIRGWYPHVTCDLKENGYKYRIETPQGDLIKEVNKVVEFDTQKLPGLSCGLLDTHLGRGTHWEYEGVIPTDSSERSEDRFTFHGEIFDHLIDDLTILGMLGHLEHGIFKQRVEF